MLVLLLYPIRKKARFARGWGPVKYWFRGHMTLGVLGPLLILYHANFSLGSMNSNVALFSMILVATSGLIGRYIYTKIHFGLYGERASLDALVARQSNAQENLNRQFSYAPSIQHQIEKFTSQTLLTPSSFLGSIWRCAAISCATRYHYFHLNREMINEIKNYGRLNKWDKKKIRMHYKQDQAELALFFRSIRKVTGFNVYEKLFSLWHVLHLPLFISMVLTGFVHVYAVHFY
ncbi:MAG: pyridine nucleotide-disulfide oxidoreductase [Gammaproteobacteria bacterium]|nr:pyridine nucleotide-disulfide oxidoreductase [Gammaproteobacteria bacterium]